MKFIDPRLEEVFEEKKVVSTAKRAEKAKVNKLKMIKQEKAKKIRKWPSARKKDSMEKRLKELDECKLEGTFLLFAAVEYVFLDRLAKKYKRGRISLDEFLAKSNLFASKTAESDERPKWL